MSQDIPTWLQDWTGRIPECLERYPLPDSVLRELLDLLQDCLHFDPVTIARRGWVGIDSENDGQLDDEMELLVEYARCKGIDTLFATSKHELDCADEGRVLLARIPQFTVEDLSALQFGGWVYEPIAAPLIEGELCWDTWREGIYFTVPIEFAIVRFREGEGHTTIVGPQDLIDMIMTRSKHDLYQWHAWP